jgi:hypothetical protein
VDFAVGLPADFLAELDRVDDVLAGILVVTKGNGRPGEETLLRRLLKRVYADFLMPSRLGEYRAFLEAALRAGYQVRSVEWMWARFGGGTPEPDGRYLMLRHDVDTDPGTVAAMWQIERDLGIAGSYFFRLSTLDPRLMDAIASSGGEVSYHYEELATIAKQRGARSREAGLRLVPEARAQFAKNLSGLRASTGQPMRIVAAHGDFANGVMGLTNSVVLEDDAFRREVGVDLEVYDPTFVEHVPERFIDAPPPVHWMPRHPADAIAAGASTIGVLVHPRQWRVNRVINAREDASRVLQGLRFRYRAPLGHQDPTTAPGPSDPDE